MKEIFFKTKDDVTIAANHFDNGFEEVVLIIPGWFMTKDSKAFLELSKELTQNYDVITMDCRGHGKSRGFYTFTAKELNDLEPVITFAKKRYKKVYLMGFSLGGALAILGGALKNDVDRIIAVSAPCDFNKIENQMWHPNAWIPTFKKCELKRWFSVRPSLIVHKKVKPVDVIENLRTPVLFMAGGRDVTVKPWHTKLLYEKAVCEKEFRLFKNSIHAEDIFLADKQKFIETCKSWLNSETTPLTPNI